MSKRTEQLTRKELIRIIDYDPEFGIMRWAVDRRNGARKGHLVGYMRPDTLVLIVQINNILYRVDHLACLYMLNDYYPGQRIGHKNGCLFMNDWNNLVPPKKMKILYYSYLKEVCQWAEEDSLDPFWHKQPSCYLSDLPRPFKSKEEKQEWYKNSIILHKRRIGRCL